MIKNIIVTLMVFFLSLLNIGSVFADQIKVENIFADITQDYKYLKELQTLYDRWMVAPDSEWKFNPKDLLNRDEFVWILTEVTCKKCIQPNTSLEILKKYENQEPAFFDIAKENKYYYCIADASHYWYISGYHPWTVCDDWTVKEWEKPFCPNNTIILEEAIAIILRASWILTNEEAEQVREDIANWLITESLSDDVSPKNLDGSVYSFYPDLAKALEYEIIEVDTDWNTYSSTLIEVVDWKIRPKQSISKEFFLRVAYLTLKANSCDEKKDNDLALSMDIFNKSCSKEKVDYCSLSNLDSSDNTYDFSENVVTTCEAWINKPEWYIWRFYNSTTWEEVKKYWEYIDDYEFTSSWEWIVFLRVIDNCWSTSEVYSTINIDNNSDLSVQIEANPIYWEWPLLIDFEGFTSWGDRPYSYYWDFWDWSTWFWKETQHLFFEWIYEVILNVVDDNWRISSATVIVKIIWNTECLVDSDNDWVNNCDDLCPLEKWEKRNNWCPVLEKECEDNSDCGEYAYCTENKVCLPKQLSNTCEYNWWSSIFWNSICNSCPCSNSLDFISKLRTCDNIFPAITSPDNSTIYSRWELYQIR